MPLFQCEKCDCVENTALGRYWGSEAKTCSECSTGQWHGKFKKKSAVGMYYARSGFLFPSENEHHSPDFKTIGQIKDRK